MTNVLLLPDPTVLALVDIDSDASTKTITAFALATSPEARCPVCQQPAHRVQSKYVRHLFPPLLKYGERKRFLSPLCKPKPGVPSAKVAMKRSSGSTNKE